MKPLAALLFLAAVALSACGPAPPPPAPIAPLSSGFDARAHVERELTHEGAKCIAGMQLDIGVLIKARLGQGRVLSSEVLGIRPRLNHEDGIRACVEKALHEVRYPEKISAPHEEVRLVVHLVDP